MKCTLIDPKTADWRALDAFADRTVFQTREWLNFIAQTQNATPILAETRESGGLAGYFSGLTVPQLVVRILGARFRGGLLPTSVSTCCRKYRARPRCARWRTWPGIRSSASTWRFPIRTSPRQTAKS